MTGGTIVGKHN